MQRPLLINGFMATGKTTVARLVAERAGVSVVDLDALIEQRAGTTAADLFATQGELAFRRLERDALDEVLQSGEPRVIALGGGALLERSVRLRAIDQAVVVRLSASFSELMRRAQSSPGQRPLLSGDAESRARQLLEQREPAYAEAHATVVSEGKSPETVAAEALAIWQRDPLGVAVGQQSYCVDVGTQVAPARVGPYVAGAPVVLRVSDLNVEPLHGAPLDAALNQVAPRVATVSLKPGEEHKNPTALNQIWQTALDVGADRQCSFVGLGGGVVTDMTGFAAACWMRGVAWVGLPTTLLAMVDASVGGKTGVDFGPAKNAVGAFCQPRHVVCDTHYLTTEPRRGYLSALAEVVKTGLIGDPALLDRLERKRQAVLDGEPEVLREVVRRCIRVKARIVSADQKEAGLRAALNLGHTIGHALEACAGYDRLTHGEAVSLGLVAALRLGVRRGVTEAETAQRTEALLESFGLPVALEEQPMDKAASLLGHDKKRAGSEVKFVFVRTPGEIHFEKLALAELKRDALTL